MKRLEGKTAWITGAGSGFGEATAIAFAQEGARVALSGRRKDELARVAKAITSAGGRAEIHPLDVADTKAVDATQRAIGGVDILVANAGLNITKRTFADIATEDWNLVIDVNLNGVFHATRAVLPAMREKRDGVIIVVSSFIGWRAHRLAGPAYAASKRGTLAIVETVNLEEGPNGIRATALCPGEAATPILDKRPVPVPPEVRATMLQPEDVAEAALYVATTKARVCVNELVISPTANRLYTMA